MPYVSEDVSKSYYKAQEEIFELLKKYDFSVYVAKEILRDTASQVELRSKLA